MKILILTDEFGYGGAQTHILALVRELRSRGHYIVVASSGGESVQKLSAKHLTLPINKKDPLSLAVSLAALDALVKKEGFDIIHAHARLPALLGHITAKKHNICFVTTVHARFSLSTPLAHLSRWGIESIAVSEDLKKYLAESYHIPPENVEVIPNGIDSRVFAPLTKKPKEICIATLSRLDTDCSLSAHLLCQIAEPLCKKYGRVNILIGGGGSELERVKKSAHSANKRLGFECVRTVGSVDEVNAFLNSASVFVGVGRAAIEAALCEIPTVICGDEGFFGRLTPENFTSALAGNFCARDSQHPTAALLLAELTEAIESQQSAEQRALRKMLASHCDIKGTAERTERFYRHALRRHKRAARGGDVVLCGYYGYANVGDDALLRSAVHRAEREFDGMGITALTKNGRRDSGHFGVDCRKRSCPLTICRTLKHAKVFIFGGGTLLQDSTSLRSLLFYSALLLYAKRCGADCRIWGGGIGELLRPLSFRATSAVLRACTYCGLRDEYSLSAAQKMLKRRCACTPVLESDLARALAPCTDARAEYLLSRAIPDERQRHGFLLVAPNGKGDIAPLCRALKSAKRKGLFPLFVVMHRREDGKPCRALAKKFGGAVLESICFSDLVGLAKQSRGVYSMRLHALIAADMAHTPAHAFGDDVKLRGYKNKF